MQEITALCGCGRKMGLDALRGRGAFRCICGARVRFQEPPYAASTCVAPEGAGRCRRVPKDDAVVPLCKEHLKAWKIAHEFIGIDEADAYVDRYTEIAIGVSDPTDTSVLTQLAVQRVHRTQSARDKLARGPVDPRVELVYYLRFDRRVKIGTTTNLPSRLIDIPHDEVLAVEPGGRVIEQSRHKQFAHLRAIGEWFRMEEPLIGHIKEIRRTHGWKGLTV